MNSDHLYAEIKSILRKHLNETEYTYMIFGSRATGTARVYSDVDIAVIGNMPVDLSIIACVNEDLENSSLPVHVDIVDFSRVSDDFKRTASKTMIPL